MRTPVVGLLVAGFISTAEGQTPDQFAKNASAFVENGSLPVYSVRESFKKDAWVKVQARVADAKWDVKKTDSLLAPVIAVVVLDLQSGVSDRLATRETAEAVSNIPWDVTERLELEYVPTTTGWAFSKGRVFNRDLKHWFQAKTHPDASVFTPQGWAIKGLAVEK
jgi:hypothetical protein